MSVDDEKVREILSKIGINEDYICENIEKFINFLKQLYRNEKINYQEPQRGFFFIVSKVVRWQYQAN